MTGEMSRSEVTREAYPLHFAIADAFEGATVEPFDQYQGPYVLVPKHGRVWISMEDDGVAVVYSERCDEKSEAFDPNWSDAAEVAANLALELLEPAGTEGQDRETYSDDQDREKLHMTHPHASLLNLALALAFWTWVARKLRRWMTP